MFESKDLKIRVNAEEAKRFNLFCEEKNLTQEQGLIHLLDLQNMTQEQPYHNIKLNDVELIFLYALVCNELEDEIEQRKSKENAEMRWGDFYLFDRIHEKLKLHVKSALER